VESPEAVFRRARARESILCACYFSDAAATTSASPAERDALHQLRCDLDALELTLPGDPEQRRLRFRAQHF